jgi:photosystem II stability/assembly factor-like uncharacterized protein
MTNDSGDTWSDISPNPEDGIYQLNHALSSDGSKLAVSTVGWDGEQNESLFVSENSGTNWTNAFDEAVLRH